MCVWEIVWVLLVHVSVCWVWEDGKLFLHVCRGCRVSCEDAYVGWGVVGVCVSMFLSMFMTFSGP